MPRRHVPFGETWSLRIPTPQSLIVRDGDRAWTSGIMALDEEGKVRASGDLLGQAEIIADYLDAALEAAEQVRDDVSRLVLYCGDHNMEHRQAAKLFFAGAFTHGPLIEMVSVPGFDYPGLLLAVDAFCAPADPVTEEDLPEGGRLRLVRENGMELLNLSAPVASLGKALAAAMSRHQLSPDRLLSGWGVSPEHALDAVPAQVAPRLPGFFSGALMPCFLGDDNVHLYLTFGTYDVELMEKRDRDLRLHYARTGDLVFLDARYLGTGGARGMAEQSHAVMEGLKKVMGENGLGFEDVLKCTTFYAAGNDDDAMHVGMQARCTYYSAPGPASTSVPVARMADIGSRVRVELVLRPADHTR